MGLAENIKSLQNDIDSLYHQYDDITAYQLLRCLNSLAEIVQELDKKTTCQTPNINYTFGFGDANTQGKT